MEQPMTGVLHCPVFSIPKCTKLLHYVLEQVRELENG